jgi:hypothetical protein
MTHHRTFEQIRHDHQANQGDFELLRSDRQKVRERLNQWSQDFVLEQYVSETDQLVGILDGSISDHDAIDIIDPSIVEDEPVNPDTVIWLDKSARPVSWFVDAFWDQFAKDGTKKPDYEFLNIDRVNWFVHMGYDESIAKWRLGPDDFDITKVDPARIDGLRALFVEGDLSEDNWREEVWNLPTRLDGQSLLIVDEVKNKGGTLSIASQVLKAAIPDAKVSATYFWHTGRYSIGKTSAESVDQQMESVPVWYDNDSKMGRGIGEISLGYWNREYALEPTQANLKRKLAAFALSAPHHDKTTFELKGDTRADMLHQDIAYLSYAVADHDVIRRPSPLRHYDEIVRIYGDQGLSPEEFKTFNHNRK